MTAIRHSPRARLQILFLGKSSESYSGTALALIPAEFPPEPDAPLGG